MTKAWILCSVVAALAACGGDGDSDPPATDGGVGGGADAGVDGDVGGPGTTLTVAVSKDGSDLHNGVDKPVETLRRAIELATADARITDIVLGPGNYTMRTGEMFPYKVPASVVIAGPSVGAAVLVGTGAETGLMFTTGQLQSVELQNFNVAVEASGSLRLKNLKIVNSATALHGDKNAKLRIDNLDISGPAQPPCAKGIVLEGELLATTVTVRNVTPALDASTPGPIDIAMASFVSASVCTRPAMQVVGVTKPFALSDTIIDGGTVGLHLAGSQGTPPEATLTNTTIENMLTGMQARNVSLTMNSGSIRNSTLIGFEGELGTFRFNRTSVSSNRGIGLRVRGGAGTAAILTMRGAFVAFNTAHGVQIEDHVDADLGTTASPGGNSFASNLGVGVAVTGQAGQGHVDAVGNTWNPNTQDSDANGQYPTRMVVVQPIAIVAGNNYGVAGGWTMAL